MPRPSPGSARLTALLAATIGMAQYDIKRIMAYSTVSQLGYMFMGIGVFTSFGAVPTTCFTHAFFKAVLFLCCGAIMHGFADSSTSASSGHPTGQGLEGRHLDDADRHVSGSPASLHRRATSRRT